MIKMTRLHHDHNYRKATLPPSPQQATPLSLKLGVYPLCPKAFKADNINIAMQQIQNKGEANMFCRGWQLFHSELFSVNDFDEAKPPHDLQDQPNHTADSINEPLRSRLKTLSKKKLAPRYEISFQKDFMKEHQAALRKYYQNHIESLKMKHEKAEIEEGDQGFFESKVEGSKETVLEVVNREDSQLSRDQQAQFLKDLQHEQKLHEFLQFVISYFPGNMAIGFLSTAHAVWSAFVPIQNQGHKISELVQLGKKMTRHTIKPLLGKYFQQYLAGAEQINEQFIDLIEVYVTTLLLTITGFFQNPYFDQAVLDEHKRAFSFEIFSDEEQGQSQQVYTPVKKRKQSAGQ